MIGTFSTRARKLTCTGEGGPAATSNPTRTAPKPPSEKLPKRPVSPPGSYPVQDSMSRTVHRQLDALDMFGDTRACAADLLDRIHALTAFEAAAAAPQE